MRPVLLCLTEVAAASLGRQQALLPHQHSEICHQDPSLVWQHDYVGTHGDRAAAHSDILLLPHHKVCQDSFVWGMQKPWCLLHIAMLSKGHQIHTWLAIGIAFHAVQKIAKYISRSNGMSQGSK